MRFTALAGALVLSLALPVFSQDEDPLPKPDTQDSASKTVPSSSASPSPAPELIPADILSSADRAPALAAPPPTEITIPQLDQSFAAVPAMPAVDLARLHLEMRELQNRVVNQADVKAALHRAELARTDLIKRKLLREYYDFYFGKMIELAATPQIVAYLNQKKQEQLASLNQPKVRPTPTPSPTPSPAKPKK